MPSVESSDADTAAAVAAADVVCGRGVPHEPVRRRDPAGDAADRGSGNSAPTEGAYFAIPWPHLQQHHHRAVERRVVVHGRGRRGRRLFVSHDAAEPAALGGRLRRRHGRRARARPDHGRARRPRLRGPWHHVRAHHRLERAVHVRARPLSGVHVARTAGLAAACDLGAVRDIAARVEHIVLLPETRDHGGRLGVSGSLAGVCGSTHGAVGLDSVCGRSAWRRGPLRLEVPGRRDRHRVPGCPAGPPDLSAAAAETAAARRRP